MRHRALALATCASLLLLPGIVGLPNAGHAADLGGEAPLEESYDYGDADYIPPSPIYYAVRGAATTSEFSMSNVGYSASLSAGVDLEQMYDLALMRLEIELNHIHQPGGSTDVDNAMVSGIVGLVSLYRDLGEFHRLRPYVGAGVGVGHLKFDADTRLNDEANGIAWHLTSGVSMEWSEQTTFDLGYRYTSVEGLEMTPVGGREQSQRFDAHSVFAGVRFRL